VTPHRWRVALVAVMVLVLLFAVRPLTHRFEPETLFLNADKVLHITLFAGLWMMARAAGFARAWPLALTLLGYGVFIEIAQSLSPTHRSASPADVAADATGIALAWWYTRRAARDSRRQPEEHRG
jgi:VanZ family protein